MAPAHQRLDAGHAPGGEWRSSAGRARPSSLRSRAWRSPASSARRSPGDHVQVARVEAGAVAALLLGPVHRDVGVGQQRGRVLPVARERADADARRQHELVVADREGGLEGADELAGDVGSRWPSPPNSSTSTTNSSPPRRARRSLTRTDGQQPARRVLQHAVAHAVAQRVVHVLEPVDVHEQERDRPAVALGPRDGVARGSR